MLAGRRTVFLAITTAAVFATACGDGAKAPAPKVGSISQAVGSSPVNSLPPPQTTNEDSQLMFSSAAGNAITVVDPDSTVTTVQITVTNGVFAAKTAKDVTITGNNTFSVILTGPTGYVNLALDGAVYVPAANYNGPAELQMNSSDNDGNPADFDVLAITVTPFNDPPVNSVPTGVQGATEDVPRAFNIPVVDVDIGTDAITVTLTSSNATTMTLPTTAGLTFNSGTGTAESSMSFEGSLQDVNAALNGLTVTPPLNYIGTSVLTITSADQAPSDGGVPGSDTDTLTISWAPVNDAPVNTVPAAQTVPEESSMTFSSANGNALSVDDVDATKALVQVTLDAQGGRLSLGTTQGLSFSVGDGTSDTTMTFAGTLVSLNAALNGTVFTPNPDFAGAAILKMISNDLGNSGAGGAKQDTDSVTINVAPANDPPVNSVPPAQVTNEDVPRIFSTANGNAISVADVDAPTLQVSLTATNGTLTLARGTGLSFQAGDGTGDASMTFTGTTTALNAALNGLVFAPTPNYSGSASISIVTTDLGATGAGEVGIASNTIAITVTPVNDPPDAVNDAFTVAEDAPATSLPVLANDTFAPDQGETLTIVAVSAPSNGSAVVANDAITYTPNANFHGTDSFSYTVSDGAASDTALVTVTVTSVNDPPTAVDDSVAVLQNSDATAISVLSNDSAAPDVGETLTIVAVTAPANGTAAIVNGGTAVTYVPSTGYSGADSFDYTISDGNGLTATATVFVTVNTVNTKPVNTLPPPQQTIEDTQLLFSSAAGNALAVADANNSTLTIQVAVTHGTFTLGATTGLTVTGNGSATVTAQGTIVSLNNGLNNARYVPAANYNGLATLTLSANDSNGETDLDVLNLTVTSVNDAPVNTVPTGVQASTEDVPKTFTNILVADVDVGASQLLVTLTADNGTVLTLSNTSGLAFIVGDGSADATMSFTGTPVSINSALNGLTVTPPPNFIGNSTLTLVTNDQGSTGGGGAGEDTDVINLSWAAVNDPPVNSVPAALATTEEVPLTLANAQALRVADSDVSAGLLQVTLNTQGGSVSLSGQGGLTFSAGDGIADATMTFSGTLQAINAALDGAVFTPAPDFAGAAAITINTTDLGNSGAGGAKQDTDTVTIQVAPVNDAPRNVVPSAQSTNEDVPRAFSVANGNAISVSDVDAPALQLSLSATNGTLTLGGKTGLSFQSGDGTADASMTVTGTAAALNAALNGLVFTPAPDYFGTAAVTLLTSDLGGTGEGGALTVQDSVTINVMPVNDPPDAANDQLTVAEDALPTTLEALANDTFAPDTGETLTITSVTQPTSGVVTFTATAVTYQPNADFNGADSFSYTVSDGNGATDTATVTVNVTSVNDDPTAVGDSVTVLQDSAGNAVNVLGNDSAAPDVGETLTVSAVSAPAHGTVVISPGATSVSYTPAGGYTGTDSFTYTLSDGNGGTAVATVSVNVAAVNTKPVNALPAPQQLIEDTQLVFSSVAGNAITVADSNNTTLTVQIAVTNGTFTLGATTGLTVTGNNSSTVTAQGTIGSLNAGLNNARYVPAANYSGAATLTVNSNDSTGESDLDVLTLNVSSVNDAPVNTVPTTAQSATEDVPKTFTNILVSDVDVGASQLQVSLAASNGTTVTLPSTTGLAFSAGDGVADAAMTFTGTPVNINAALNGLTVTPPANFIGQSTLVIVTNDLGNTGNGGPAQDSDQVTINWASDNDPPVNAVPAAQEVLEETPMFFAAAAGTGLSVTDADIGAGLMKITLTAVNGRLTLGNASGVTLTAGTGAGDTTMTFTGTLNAVNAALEGTSFVPNPDFVGTATVTLLSNDQGNTGGAAKSDSDTVAIVVSGINDPPVNTLPNPQFIAEDGVLLFSTANGNPVKVADVDAASLQVTLSASNGTVALQTKTNLTFQSGDGTAAPTMTFSGTLAALNGALNTLRFVPTPNYAGAATLTVVTQDLGLSGAGGALSDEDVLSITVVPVNDPPTAANDTFSVDEDCGPTQLEVLANDTFAPDEAETLTISSVTSPLHGTATTNGTVVTYAPAANYFGSDSFSYTIGDGQGGTASATVTVTVRSINDPPDALADTLTVAENSAPTTVPVLANDTIAPDTGETLTVTAVSAPAHGTATIVNGGSGIQYQPTADYSGPDLFTYTVSDGQGGTDTADVTVTVTPFDYQPAAVADTLTLPEDSSAAVDVLANDTGLGNQPVTVAISAGPTHGSAVVQPGNAVLYTPAPDYRGPDSFTYTVTDSGGDSSTATVTITVTDVNDLPVAADDAATTDEDVAVKIPVQANDLGLVDLPVTLAVTKAPAHGTTTLEVDGTITYAPADNYNGVDLFEYTATDADGQNTTATVTVTINAINDAPLAVPDAVSTRTGEARVIDVLANDVEVDGDPLVISSVTAPVHGAATLVDGKVNYAPAPGFSGTDQFQYTIDDGTGLTSTAAVVVGVGLDTDGDGLSDVDELALGTRPDLADSDHDLLTDGVEVNFAGTDPLDADTDDDGLLDGAEDANQSGVVDPNETDPNKRDSDGDGLLDGTERGLTAPQTQDTDTSVFVADLDPATTTDPCNPDTDNGGVQDGVEDANHNGRKDWGETDPNKASDDQPNGPDLDRDGVSDSADNCPQDANAGQEDADNDGLGDACDDSSGLLGCGCGAGPMGSGGFAALVGMIVVAVHLRGRRRRAHR